MLGFIKDLNKIGSVIQLSANYHVPAAQSKVVFNTKIDSVTRGLIKGTIKLIKIVLNFDV